MSKLARAFLYVLMLVTVFSFVSGDAWAASKNTKNTQNPAKTQGKTSTKNTSQTPGTAGTASDASGGTICRFDSRGPSVSGMVDCATMTNNCGDQTTNAGSSMYGVRLNTGVAQTPIDVHSRCRYFDNVNSNSYFVPFKSSLEWQAFRSHLPAGVSETHCARPFSGQNMAQGLYFGPTSALFAMGDTGDPVTANVSLPYWRTGASWPPSSGTCSNASHTFNNRCYEEYSQYTCWKWVNQTCTGSSCSATDPVTGACTATTTYTYDCSYCGDPGSTCQQRWYNWSETFGLTAVALDSDTQNPSWQGTSTRTGGSTRPAQCMTRCTFDGHDCTNCTGAPPACVPNGTTTCVAGRRYDSCGTDIGACAACCCAYWGY